MISQRRCSSESVTGSRSTATSQLTPQCSASQSVLAGGGGRGGGEGMDVNVRATVEGQRGGGCQGSGPERY